MHKSRDAVDTANPEFPRDNVARYQHVTAQTDDCALSGVFEIDGRWSITAAVSLQGRRCRAGFVTGAVGQSCRLINRRCAHAPGDRIFQPAESGADNTALKALTRLDGTAPAALWFNLLSNGQTGVSTYKGD